MMDTDCLQDEISVAPERTAAASSTSSRLTGRDNREDAGETEGRTHQWKVTKDAKDGDADTITLSRIEAAKQSLEKVMNGDSKRRGAEGEGDKDLQTSEITRLKDASLTSSPSPSFKSSYAKSLADSYRRASIPVVVSSPKGQFYFKNNEFFSLSGNAVKDLDGSYGKFSSLNVSVGSRTAPAQMSKLQSLPTIIDSNEEQREAENKDNLLPTSVYEKLVNKDVFVPCEQLHQLCEEEGGSFSLKDLNSLCSIITSDGRKLVKLSDFKLLISDEPSKTHNGHQILISGSEKDTQQVESLLLERGQLGDRVDQLCRVLAERDSTIQRLEEDLLRIRMECQRLLVDNRSLKSTLGHHGASQSQCAGTDDTSQVSQLQQQVQLLTAQLKKADQSRLTYEAATRQLVDFLHTVNSTLNASHLNHNAGSPATSPTSSLHSSTSTTTTKTSSGVPVDDDDPPYRLGPSSTPLAEAVSSRPTQGSSSRSNVDAMKKAGSVWALPTHSHNLQERKVSRAASTHCVVSATSASLDDPPAAGAVTVGSSSGNERTRSHTTEFLASRTKELLTSLKSLIRSDSILKLNLEPKKSSSSVSDGKNRRSRKSTKVENIVSTSSVFFPDTEQSGKTITLLDPQNSDVQENRQPTNLNLSFVGEEDKKCLKISEINTSPTVGQNHDSTSTITVPLPRIGTGKTREDTLQPQSPVVNGNPQPLSLMVVGDPPCNPSDQRFSSLPLRTRITRTLTDADHRLVWV